MSTRVSCLWDVFSIFPKSQGSTTGAASPNGVLYQPLNKAKREIRVLCLHSSVKQGAGVQASLKTVSLISPPSFKALSYCWGDSGPSKLIKIGQHRVKVTDNLESALRHIRKPNESILLWIDALSINQSDVDEKNFQLQLMAEIYRDAQSVLVWLGKATDDSNHAMKIARKWGKKHLDRESRYLVLKVRNKKFDERSWKALSKLLSRPYWTRTWVYQELLLGRKTFVRCGSKEIDWKCFKGLDEAWYQLERKMDIFRLELRPDHLTMVEESGLGDLSLFLNFKEAKDQAALLFPMLKWTSALSCKDPRDRIYAMMGLARDTDCYPSPDYSQDVVEVYKAFARAQIELTGNLDILHESACRQTHQGPHEFHQRLPSWVPDWTIKAGCHIPYSAHYELYKASFAAPTIPTSELFCCSSPVVKPQGVLIDTVSRVSPESITSLGLPETLAFIENTDHKYGGRDYRSLKGFTYAHPTGLPLANILFRTCLMDLDFRLGTRLDFTTCPQIALQLAEAFLILLAMSYGVTAPTELTVEQIIDLKIPPLDLNFDFLPPGGDLAAQFPHIATFERYKMHYTSTEGETLRNMFVEMFDRHVNHFTTGRTLFCTQKGYVGLSTNDSIKEGDALVALFGCKTPVILRPLLSQNDRGYEFVSDVFAHGLMDGEAVEGISRDEGGFSYTQEWDEERRLDLQFFHIH